jgi:hypothetical protein
MPVFRAETFIGASPATAYVSEPGLAWLHMEYLFWLYPKKGMGNKENPCL